MLLFSSFMKFEKNKFYINFVLYTFVFLSTNFMLRSFCSGDNVELYNNDVYFYQDQNFVRIVKRQISNSSDENQIEKTILSKDNESVDSSTDANDISPIITTEDSTIILPNGTELLEVDGQNTTIKGVDHHMYYNSSTKKGRKEVENFWVEMEELSSKVILHDALSDSYRRAFTVGLSFEFPFYGHILHNVTITTGGFLYTGSFLHKWLAATQYIAPLMANFDTSVSPDANVKYSDNGTSLTVQWEKVKLKHNPTSGSFTFQATIHETGRIVFAYKDVPIVVKQIKDEEHPVKVGLSDAYIVQKTIFYVRKKTIYEYHKIDLKNESIIAIDNWTAIVFEPRPNCIIFKTCDECLTIKTDFNCAWCSKVDRCSDGLDRHRQDWLTGRCDVAAITSAATCASLPPPTTSTLQTSHKISNAELSSDTSTARGISNSVTTLIVFIVLAILVGGWVTYAYFFPHSSSGQFLIKYRPSRWSWRRGEARYTAATMHSIHM